MPIPDSDPRARDLDAAFAAAATGPQKPRAEAKTPADIDQDAPHGRDEAGEPLAPFGRTRDGRVKRSIRGRPSKSSPDMPRTAPPAETPAADAPPGKKAKPDPHDWSEDLSGFAEGIWFGMSAAAKVAPHIPVLGKQLPAEKLAAEAFVLSETTPRLVAAVNLAAQHNASAAKFCKGLEGGDGLWALSCMFMVLPVVSLAVTVWKGDEKELLADDLPSVKAMAERNEKKMDAMVDRINRQIAASAASVTIADVKAEAEFAARTGPEDA